MDSAVLFFVDYLGDKATPAEVSRWLTRKHHTIITQLRRMERKGLVTLIKGIIKKNVISINLTDKGREALRYSGIRKSLHNIFSSLSKDGRKQLRINLMKLREAGTKEMG
jgi:DNA-binding MarR family transcriptional regulator